MLKCGAKNRQGGQCGQMAMPNGKCHYHGGKSTGPPEGNQNALKHGIYASALLDHEIEDYLGAKELKSLTEDRRWRGSVCLELRKCTVSSS